MTVQNGRATSVFAAAFRTRPAVGLSIQAEGPPLAAFGGRTFRRDGIIARDWIIRTKLCHRTENWARKRWLPLHVPIVECPVLAIRDRLDHPEFRPLSL